MAAIALTVIILLNYLAFYYAYGAFEGSVGTKKKRFFPAKNPIDARREVVGHCFVVPEQNIVNTLGMIIRMYCIIYAVSVHYEHRTLVDRA
jgi:hypothetical protein